MTRPAREFALDFDAVVVCPTYKLLPEHAFPAPAQSAWEVLLHLSRRAASLGADPRAGFVVGGVSAGGSVAAVAGAIAGFGAEGALGLEPLAAPLTGCWVSGAVLVGGPILPAAFAGQFAAREENRDVEGFNTWQLESVLAYLRPEWTSPWFSPLNLADRPVVEGAPRFAFQVGKLDPLRDDNIIVSKVVASKGAETQLAVFPLDGHMAYTALPFEGKSTTPTIKETTMSQMAWLLRREESA
jgi:acetyl esterase/lipase